MTLAQFFRSLRVAVLQSVQSDSLDIAKAAAYSGMLMLFPAFLVVTTLLALVPAGYSLLDEIRSASEQFLPADTMSLLQSLFLTRHTSSIQLLLSASALSAIAAWGVMSSLMDGFRRAYRLPQRRVRKGSVGRWSFWQHRLRALLLVPIALIPLSVATLVIVFGHPIEEWMIANSDHELRAAVLLLWRLLRWSLALLTSSTVLGALYHFGTNSRERWTAVIPGAVTATLLWFPVTIAFGVYVTRLADYSVLYGPLGTAIATLVWLYITSYSVLLGAQLNGVRYRNRRKLAIRTHALAQARAASATSERPAPTTPGDAGRNNRADNLSGRLRKLRSPKESRS